MIKAKTPKIKIKPFSKMKVNKKVASGVTMEKISSINAFLKRFFLGCHNFILLKCSVHIVYPTNSRMSTKCRMFFDKIFL